MELSRKRQRELKKLRSYTQDLLDQQREVMSNANFVLGEAGKQAKALGQEQVMPMVNQRLDQVRPVIDRNVDAAKRAVDRAKLVVAPAVAVALAKTVSALNNIEAKNAATHLQDYGVQHGILEAPKKKRKASTIIAIGAGIAAASVVGYALWQAFRDDSEDMWVSNDQ